MQSVGKNINVRIRNPLYLAASGLAIGSLLLAGGCRTGSPATQVAEPPPTVVMPPAPAPTNAITLTPPSAQPDFRLPPPPAALTPEQAGGIAYTVKNGDSLSLIAARYGVSAREIAELNGIGNPNKIRAGQKLVMPAYAKERAVAQKKTVKKPVVKKAAGSAAPKAAAAAGDEYVVKSGDSLSKIAANHRVKLKDLREVNNLQNDNLKIGQKLKIPGRDGSAPAAAVATAVETVPPPPAPEAPAPAPAAIPEVAASVPAATPGSVPSPAPAVAPQTFEITVDAGESLASIASRYGVLPDEIRKLNNITEVVAGQKIKLPLPTP